MITKEKLIKYGMIRTETDTQEEFEKLISEWGTPNYYYNDIIIILQDIIYDLDLSFRINNLEEYGVIAYYEKDNRIIHIGNVSMSYDSIDELLDELNEFENLVPNN